MSVCVESARWLRASTYSSVVLHEVSSAANTGRATLLAGQLPLMDN